MKRMILAAGLALMLLPLPGTAQYPPGGYGAYDAPDQMVQEWYSKFLRRPADPAASTWADQLRSGQTPEDVLAQILGSPEYYNRGGGNPEGFIRRLYLDVTGRPPSARELQFWVNDLYRSDRHDVAYRMLQRFPQSWSGGSPDADPDYRRPFLRYRR